MVRFERKGLLAAIAMLVALLVGLLAYAQAAHADEVAPPWEDNTQLVYVNEGGGYPF